LEFRLQAVAQAAVQNIEQLTRQEIADKSRMAAIVNQEYG
jgi:hypothetical protein